MFEVRLSVFLVAFQPEGKADQDTTIVCDEVGRTAIEIMVAATGGATRSVNVVLSHLRTDPPRPAVEQPQRQTLSSDPFPLTAELVGKRVLYLCGPSHIYEHIYLTSDLFVWHDIGGHRADTESMLTCRLDDDLYLVHWTERAEARAATMVVDLAELGITGSLFGWQPIAGANHHITVGATAQVLNETNFGGLEI